MRELLRVSVAIIARPSSKRRQLVSYWKKINPSVNI